MIDLINKYHNPTTELLQKVAVIRTDIDKLVKDKDNPYFNSKYFDVNQLLEHVHPYLIDYDLTLIQPVLGDYVWTVIYNRGDSGGSIASGIKLPDDMNPQKIGGAITYYRRYGLQSLLGLQAEDDDANDASGNTGGTSQTSQKDDDDKPWLNKTEYKSDELTQQWKDVVRALESGKYSVAQVTSKYRVSKKLYAELSKIEDDAKAQ